MKSLGDHGYSPHRCLFPYELKLGNGTLQFKRKFLHIQFETKSKSKSVEDLRHVLITGATPTSPDTSGSHMSTSQQAEQVASVLLCPGLSVISVIPRLAAFLRVCSISLYICTVRQELAAKVASVLRGVEYIVWTKIS
ncbi:hypothetical protein RRG08_020033 [Elysia crispata]|uniref:Uncharacterized protein n=1 Tax=Elysia crispata TaxID=231223 RepID=A0AAE1BCV2_9GAST|nr:hypothetical protein RRG08_020033 [Elysia crispata]